MKKKANHPIDVYCKAEGVTYAEVARRSELTRQAIYGILRGRSACGRKAALALHKGCGIPVEDLLLWEVAP